MKDLIKRTGKEDERELQASTLDLDLGYETAFHNSALDIGDEQEIDVEDTKYEKKFKKADVNGNTDPSHFQNEPADFETAISNTGFGKFNYLLLIAIVPPSMSAIFGTSSMSFILPVASFELELSSFQKGILNGAIYSGMILSGFFWGFLSDVMGRQMPLCLGLLADGIASFCLACSQSFQYLVLFKFLAGIAICGPFSLVYAYLSEFFDKSRRDTIVMMTGCFTSFGSLLQPVLAYYIIPNDWEFRPFDLLLINSWRIFLMLSTLPSLSGALLVYFLPETPKFLMTHGKTDEALQVFQKMYSMNTGKPKDSYPVKRLLSGISHASSDTKTTFLQAVGRGWKQVNPLFRKPYLGTALIIFFLQALTMASLNTVRLLQPQIFASYLSHKTSDDINVCASIIPNPQHLRFHPHINSSNITFNIGAHISIDSRVYFNATMVGLCTFLYYIMAGFLVKVLGKKKMYVISVLLCSACIGVYPWSYSIHVVVLACVFISVMSTAVTMVLGCSVQQFPTTLRALAVNMTMISGRIGVLIGSLLFSVFIEKYCHGSFLMLAAINILCAGIMMFCLTMRTAEDGDVANMRNESVSVQQLTKSEDLDAETNISIEEISKEMCEQKVRDDTSL